MSDITKQQVEDAVKKLSKALEAGLYRVDFPRYRLESLLSKLGIKSARRGLEFGAALEIESLSATLVNATFDDTKLKLHKKTK